MNQYFSKHSWLRRVFLITRIYYSRQEDTDDISRLCINSHRHVQPFLARQLAKRAVITSRGLYDRFLHKRYTKDRSKLL